MLSVLIPIYNCDVYALVKELHFQLSQIDIPFEILCFDDGSNDLKITSENRNILEFSNTSYSENKKNCGRSIIRNQLAEKAKFEYLLFIDNDSLISDPHFIEKYVAELSKDFDVIYGGRIHPDHVKQNQKLRWLYGKEREDLNAAQRKRYPYKCLLFNNTIIKKSIFSSIQFNQEIVTYGHEDTLLAYRIALLNANILHIDNPVIHNDIDTNSEFLNKTDLSLQNLKILYNSKAIDYSFVRFLRIYRKIEKLGIAFILKFMHSILRKPLRSQLRSNKPHLFIYDLYRFGYFSSINHKR